jgi:uncharacterized protein (DUF1697 family)
LRGVNVGTKNSLPMTELRAMLEAIGCTEVQTYVQSGNAVFTTRLRETQLTEAIDAALRGYMGRPIATTLRTQQEIETIVRAGHFLSVAHNPAYLCVTFLSQPPTRAEIAPLYAQDFAPELFEISGREIHSWRPSGNGRSPLAVALGKLRLRGAVTTRNWNTVLKLLEMLTEGSRG